MSLGSSTWRAGTAAHGHCGNCGAQLNGTYCGVCGQAGHLHRSLLHLAEEFLHGVLHFDTKGFRTLPLLVARPGLLTRRYIAGQRTRYVSPLANAEEAAIERLGSFAAAHMLSSRPVISQ